MIEPHYITQDNLYSTLLPQNKYTFGPTMLHLVPKEKAKAKAKALRNRALTCPSSVTISLCHHISTSSAFLLPLLKVLFLNNNREQSLLFQDI